MNQKVILYVILGIVILILIIFTLFPGTIRAWKDSGKSTEDKCKPAPGYTEEEWREHMSHHPNIYSECLS